MAQRPDAELLEVVESPDGTYRPEAIEAARAELARRNITVRPPEEAAKAREATEASRAAEPLEGMWILGAIAMPLLFFPWFVAASRFEREGYLRKARTLRRV